MGSPTTTTIDINADLTGWAKWLFGKVEGVTCADGAVTFSLDEKHREGIIDQIKIGASCTTREEMRFLKRAGHALGFDLGVWRVGQIGCN